MKLILLGAPGAGKGTQAEIVCDKLNIPAISTGNILREAMKNETEMGVKAKAFIDSGALVPDDVIIGIIKERLAQDDCKNGLILDGVPRTVAQAEALEEMGVQLDAVLSFTVDADVVVERMLARGRADDNEDVIRNRLSVYATETAPLLEHYGSEVTSIDAVGEVHEVHLRVLASLGVDADAPGE